MLELEMRSITKSFGDLIANDQIDFSMKSGEIRALLGENGAGKTTLMRILFGLYKQDAGEILLRGKAVDFQSPKDSIANNIGMVHQHFFLFENLTVAENVVYGKEPRKYGVFYDSTTAEKEVEELAKSHGLKIDPRAKISELSVGERQRVEILKILYRSANILILDEPTAVLTPLEGMELFKILRELAIQGKSIIIITHKLPEVMAVAHRATVLRRGKVTGEVDICDTNPNELARLMIGREMLPLVERVPSEPGEEILSIENLHLKGLNKKPILNNISFKIRKGEIVGIAGVAGNGQTELVDLIVGLRKCDNGRIIIEGIDVTSADIIQRRNRGLAYIPEDHNKRGLASDVSIAENLAFGFHRQLPISKNGVLNLSLIKEFSEKLVDEYDIRISEVDDYAETLSGGNLQKMVIAREFSRQAHFIIADQPTRGVDISAKEFIHRQLIKRRDLGDAILLISAELDEIMALSDRILVMLEGKIVAELSDADVDEYKLGMFMTGGHEVSESIGKNKTSLKEFNNAN